MDYNMVDIEKMTDKERVQFQSENHVMVLGKQYGSDYYDDCRPNVFGMVNYLSPDATGVNAKMKKSLPEDDLIAFRRQLSGYLFIAFSKGLPIVLPRFNEFTFGQEEDFKKAVKVAIAKNAEIIKKYSVTLPQQTRDNTISK